MRTWTILDNNQWDQRTRGQCRLRRNLATVAVIVMIGVMILVATTGTPIRHVSSSPSINPLNTRFAWDTGNFLQDERHRGTKKLPKALIIGAKKSGTRALLEFIRVHPNVRAAGHEVHYFDKNYSRGPEWYRSMMPTSIHGQITIEKTPSYLVTLNAPERVYRLDKNMKLIVVLKDPVERAISDHTQSREKHRDKRSFENSVFIDAGKLKINDTKPCIVIGKYSDHLKRWLQYFPREQFCFISGENLASIRKSRMARSFGTVSFLTSLQAKNPSSELEKLQEFLNIRTVITEEHFYYNSTKRFPCLKKREASGVPHCLGETKGRVHPTVLKSVKTALYEYYKPYNEELYRMVGIDFGWERTTPLSRANQLS